MGSSPKRHSDGPFGPQELSGLTAVELQDDSPQVGWLAWLGKVQ